MDGHAREANEKRIRHLACAGLHAGYVPGNYISKDISFEIFEGELMAIMGPSGSGKSTLVRALLGNVPEASGRVMLNGRDLGRAGLSVVRSQVGLVPQDDVLVPELTVRENLRSFHAVAVDSGLASAALEARIERILDALDIRKIADRRVGSSDGTRFNISGGQRKRVNIAMELVNEPKILILDEPTSGLSSEDSLKIVAALKALAEQQRMMVIMIIHQPSSDIFKMIDRLLLLDRTGSGVASGPRAEVVGRVSRLSHRIDAGCAACGTEFPDRVMGVVESRGDGWREEARRFSEGFVPRSGNGVEGPIPRERVLPRPVEWSRDFIALVGRQMRMKLRDRMGLLVNVVAPVLLGGLVGVVFKSTPPGAPYAYETNLLFPQMLFMLVVCGMFLGLVGSVFEVIKDRAMLRREQMRGLSTSTYYLAELSALTLVALPPALLLPAGALWANGAMHLFAAVAFPVFLAILVGATLGLLVSALFTSTIAAYNMIPALLVPQIILGGALLAYQDMGEEIRLWRDDTPGSQPLLAKATPASWIYEYAVRRVHTASESADRPQNAAILALGDLPRGAFASMSPGRVATSDAVHVLSLGRRTEARPDDANLLGILGFLVLASGSGLLWIRWEFASAPSPWAWGLVQCLAAGVVVTSYYLLTASTEVEAPTPPASQVSASTQGMQVSSRSFSFGGAGRFCEQRGARMSSVDELLAAHNAQVLLVPRALFWTRDDGGESRVMVLDFTKLAPDTRGPLSVASLADQPRVLYAARRNAFWAHVACTPVETLSSFEDPVSRPERPRSRVPQHRPSSGEEA